MERIDRGEKATLRGETTQILGPGVEKKEIGVKGGEAWGKGEIIKGIGGSKSFLQGGFRWNWFSGKFPERYEGVRSWIGLEILGLPYLFKDNP